MLLQETYGILDTLVYAPNGTGSTSNWIKSGNGTVTVGDSSTTVTASSNTTYRSKTAITGDFEITFQATLTGSVRIGVQTSSEYNYAQSKFSYYDVTDYYFKIKRVGSTITAQYSSDGVNWSNRSLETNNVGERDCYFLISVETTGTERTIDYKDLKIYSI